MNLWDRLLPQAIQTPNLLHTSHLHPQISAYAHVHGLNRTPLAPHGMKVLIPEKPHLGTPCGLGVGILARQCTTTVATVYGLANLVMNALPTP
jgi:hypothetical protein